MSHLIRPLLAELKAGLKAIYGERLRGVYLFGSYARDEEQTESDIDVLIVLDEIPSYGNEIERTGYLASSLSLRYGVTISRVFVPEQDWTSSESPFLANVREEAVPA
jgi:predicted nucleotidyltransferase